jgi:hypothetical protein
MDSTMNKSKTRTWVFDMGNSTRGDIGYVIRVEAESKARAVELAYDALPENIDHDFDATEEGETVDLQVYFNVDPTTMKKRLARAARIE